MWKVFNVFLCFEKAEKVGRKLKLDSQTEGWWEGRRFSFESSFETRCPYLSVKCRLRTSSNMSHKCSSKSGRWVHGVATGFFTSILTQMIHHLFEDWSGTWTVKLIWLSCEYLDCLRNNMFYSLWFRSYMLPTLCTQINSFDALSPLCHFRNPVFQSPRHGLIIHRLPTFHFQNIP